MGYMTEQADAHNEMALISFCKNHLKAATVPFEDKLQFYNEMRELWLLVSKVACDHLAGW